MPDRAQIRRHASLVDRMATTRGIDLQDKALAGEVSFDDISEAVLKCTQCSNPANCSRWLDQRSRSATGPDYCQNSELFDALAPQDI